MAKKKTKKKKTAKKKTAPKKLARKKPAPKKKPAAKRKPARRQKCTGKLYGFGRLDVGARSDDHSGSAGQSGDIQGLSRRERADSESVTELLEDGQAYEAEVVEGVEDAPDPDVSEVKTHEVPEDDVPEEYDGEQ